MTYNFDMSSDLDTTPSTSAAAPALIFTSPTNASHINLPVCLPLTFHAFAEETP